MLRKERIYQLANVTRVGLFFVLVFGPVTSAFARERGPRVEVICPSPPIPVRIDKSQVLVYELHITNFDTVPLTLQASKSSPTKKAARHSALWPTQHYRRR